jgi:hypothetical protein
VAIVKVTPIRFEMHQHQLSLVLEVDTPPDVSWRRKHKWYSPPDATVEQVCSAVGAYFGVEFVDFQPPLFALHTKEYHAGDYIK